MQGKKMNPALLRFPRQNKNYQAIKHEWAPNTQAYFGQGIKPHDPQLLPKLGLHQGEKILVFAGYTGAWARSLATQCKVTFTDLTAEAAALAKTKPKSSKIKWLKRFDTPPGKYYSVHTMPAESAIQRPKAYDWSFSFEPIPLEKQNTLKLTILHCLLNNKGGILVYRQMFGEWLMKKDMGDIIAQHAEQIANLYGAEVPPVKNEKIQGTFILRKCQIVKVLTNDSARKRAWLDIRLSRILARSEKNGQMLDSTETEKSLGVSAEELKQSIKRLSKLERLKVEDVFNSAMQTRASH